MRIVLFLLGCICLYGCPDRIEEPNHYPLHEIVVKDAVGNFYMLRAHDESRTSNDWETYYLAPIQKSDLDSLYKK